MRKEFVFNIILLLIINILVKLSYLFFIEVNVQNNLGPDEYGIFLALFNFSYLFQFINDPGIQSYNATSIASGQQSIHGGFSSIVGVKIIGGALFIGSILICGTWMGYNQEGWMMLLFLISCNHILSTFFMLIRSTLSGNGHYRQDSYISALDKLFMIAIIGYLLYDKCPDFRLEDFVLGQMASYILAIIVGLLLLAYKKISFTPRVSFRQSITIIKKSAPYALILLLMASYNKMDGVMLERLLPDGAYQAGIYAASLRYMDAANMGAYLFAGLLLPMFARVKNNAREIDDLAQLAIKWMMTLVGTVVVVGIIYRTELMSIYNAINDQYDNLLILHLMSFGAVGVSYIYGTLLTATGKLKGMNIILLAGLIVNLILNLILIPKSMATGAAIATFATQAVVMIGQLIVAIVLFKLSIKLLDVLKLIGFIGLSFIIINEWHDFVHLSWYLSASVGAMFVVILSFLLGIIRKDMIFALIK